MTLARSLPEVLDIAIEERHPLLPAREKIQQTRGGRHQAGLRRRRSNVRQLQLKTNPLRGPSEVACIGQHTLSVCKSGSLAVVALPISVAR